MARYVLQKRDKIELEKGDRIRLVEGMTITTSVPIRFVADKYPLSNKMDQFAVIVIGENRYKKAISKKDVVNKLMDSIPNDLNMPREAINKTSLKHLKDFVDSLSINWDKEEFDTSIYVGEYIVEDVTFNSREIPNYFCVKVDDPSIHVNFETISN